MAIKAPELSKATDWLNVSQPLTLEMLKGKIVLLDFWTFCCVDCMHILPYLKQLEQTYPDVLVVIGVHSAKFPNEKDSAQIRKAIARYGIEHPVANDSRFAIWEEYWIREWPTLVLIDPDGFMQKQIPCSKRPYGQLDVDISEMVENFGNQGKLNRNALPFTWGPGSEPTVHEGASHKQSLLSYPGKVISNGEQLFISDTGHNRIVICDLDGTIQFLIGSGDPGKEDGDYKNSSFRAPQGLALNGQDLYIADTENHLIRKIDLHSKQVTTVAGTGTQALLAGKPLLGGPALSTGLSSPWDLVFLKDRLYVCMAGSHQIWCYEPETAFVSVYAGNAVESLKDGPLTEANLAQPSGITTDGTNLYFADAETSSIRSINTIANSREVITITGKGLFEFGDKDGEASVAKLQHPLAVVSLADKLYVADSYNHKIKSICLNSKQVQTLAGSKAAGLQDGASSQFSEPGGLTGVGQSLYVADTNNHAIRIIDINTGTTKTLALIDPTRVSYFDSQLPNVQTIKLPPLSISVAKPLTIAISAILPAQTHVNIEAPLLAEAQSKLFGKSVTCNHDGKGGFTLTTGPVTAGFDELEVMLQLYYCSDGDDSSCHVVSFIYHGPIESTDESCPTLNHVALTAQIAAKPFQVKS